MTRPPLFKKAGVGFVRGATGNTHNPNTPGSVLPKRSPIYSQILRNVSVGGGEQNLGCYAGEQRGLDLHAYKEEEL